MKPDPRFTGKPLRFWANVKLVSEQAGYSVRAASGRPKALRKYDVADVARVYKEEGLDPHFSGRERAFLEEVIAYMNYRADLIQEAVQPLLMDRAQAAAEYSSLLGRTRSRRAPHMNKQKGEKRHPAYLASMVSLIAEEILGPKGFVDDARRLSVVSTDGIAEFAFSRRFDGALPTVANPSAVWEIKEYYGTTTFGSRVADGVYETLLDGAEINEAEKIFRTRIKHFLFIDDRFTWWECGRSYLCRIIDMLHTGHVDEVFFGREVVTEWRKALEAYRPFPQVGAI